jgi:hypothetical protein
VHVAQRNGRPGPLVDAELSDHAGRGDSRAGTGTVTTAIPAASPGAGPRRDRPADAAGALVRSGRSTSENEPPGPARVGPRGWVYGGAPEGSHTGSSPRRGVRTSPSPRCRHRGACPTPGRRRGGRHPSRHHPTRGAAPPTRPHQRHRPRLPPHPGDLPGRPQRPALPPRRRRLYRHRWPSCQNGDDEWPRVRHRQQRARRVTSCLPLPPPSSLATRLSRPPMQTQRSSRPPSSQMSWARRVTPPGVATGEHTTVRSPYAEGMTLEVTGASR